MLEYILNWLSQLEKIEIQALDEFVAEQQSLEAWARGIRALQALVS